MTTLVKSPDSPERTVRLGIVGVGNMGRMHAGAVLDGKVPGLKLTAVCDSDPDCLAQLNDVPDLPHFNDAAALIASHSVDAVLIATPHYDHTTVGIQVLEAGLHLLVEKPISVHKADCLRLIDAHKPDSPAVFAAMFNQRTDPRYIKLRDLLRSGEVGELRRVNWIITDWFRSEAYYQSGGWRATWAGEGGGVLLNQCPHQLDLWQWLFGMPDAVTASCQIGRFHDIEVEDSVTAVLEYASGVRGVFVTTTGEAPGENRLTVATNRGLIVVEPDGLRFTRTEQPVQEYSRTTDQKFSPPPVWEIRVPTSGTGEQHVGVLKNFVAAILDGAPLIAPAAEGIHSVELANAMLLSGFRSSKVSLPIDASDYEAELGKLIARSTFVKKTVLQPAGQDDFAKSF